MLLYMPFPSIGSLSYGFFLKYILFVFWGLLSDARARFPFLSSFFSCFPFSYGQFSHFLPLFLKVINRSSTSNPLPPVLCSPVPKKPKLNILAVYHFFQAKGRPFSGDRVVFRELWSAKCSSQSLVCRSVLRSDFELPFFLAVLLCTLKLTIAFYFILLYLNFHVLSCFDCCVLHSPPPFFLASSSLISWIVMP